MRVTVLTENTAEREDIRAEHGLSLYIETERHTVLLDMGQTDAFARNADTLGVDLGKVDVAVLSHGHYDHGGGMHAFFARNDHAPVYLSRHAFGAHYNGTQKYIGLDPALRESHRLRFTDGTLVLDGELSLYACADRERVAEINPFGLCVQRSGEFQPEDFLHEQYLVIREGEKRVLFSGCSHRGILNIVHWFSPDVLVGGFHFSKLDPDLPADAAFLRDAAECLLAFPTRYFTGHCTGLPVYEFMRARMGDRLTRISAGMSFTL